MKEPTVACEDWEDAKNVHVPVEWLTIDKDKVNEFCRNTNKSVMAGASPRPFEQLQFIIRIENLYVDLMLRKLLIKQYLTILS